MDGLSAKLIGSPKASMSLGLDEDSGSCLSTTKGKVIAVIALGMAVLLVLHASGALSGAEQFLSDKVFTPMGDFFSEHKDLIVYKVLPAIAGTTVGLIVLGSGARKAKAYADKKAIERKRAYQAMVSNQVRQGYEDAFKEGGQADLEIKRRVAEGLDARVDSEIERRKEAAIKREEETRTQFVKEEFVDPEIARLREELAAKEASLQSAQKRTGTISKAQLPTFASMMHERGTSSWGYPIKVTYYGPNPQDPEGSYITHQDTMLSTDFEQYKRKVEARGGRLFNEGPVEDCRVGIERLKMVRA